MQLTYLKLANSLNEIMREEYKGSWESDLMSGWGVYKYFIFLKLLDI